MTQQPPRKLEMSARKKSSAAPVTIIIVLLALCGGGAWYMLTQRGGPVPSELPSADSSSVSGRTFTGNAPAGTGGLPPGERDAAGRTGTGMAGAAGETSDGPQAAGGRTSSNVMSGAGGGELSGASGEGERNGTPLSAASALPAEEDRGEGRTVRASRGRDKADSGNIVEPPAGVRSPVLVTEPSGGRGASGSAASPSASPSERDRRIAAVEAAVREGGHRSETGTGGAPSYGMSMGGALDSPEAYDASGSLAAEASEDGDSVITPYFVRGLARWLADHYTPSATSGGRGRVSASVSAANATFGQSMSGLRHRGGDSSSGRAFVLNHAWSPGMLEALYRMYDDSFVQAMRDAAARRSKGALDAGQTADMFRAYAGQFRLLDAGLRGVAGMADLDAGVGMLREAERETGQARRELASLVRSYEAAREQGDSSRADALRARMENASRRIQRATEARTRAERELTDEIRRRAGGKTPDDATLLYLAQWVERRDSGPESAAVAAGLLGRMAERFDAEAGVR